MLKFSELNNLLISNVIEMKASYDEICKGGDCSPHWLYDYHFVPYVIEQLEKGNERKLKKAFEVIEYIYAHGNRSCTYVATVSFAEHLCGMAYKKYREKIISLCGSKSKKVFTTILDEYP